ncbi:MAG TPA: divergent polysaccharide deacetylase family protein [Woeseiaceae bacterium]|nr:divergent polysaccharide deacetylase family protein [Woeseiaceae bacterium]
MAAGAAALALSAPACAAPPTPTIAIIIDDLGYQLAAGRRAVALPGPVACAVLPSTPRAKLLAEAAYTAGKDVLLHLPLQPMDWDGTAEPGAILLDMTRGELSRSFAASLHSIPHVVGVNTHQGSLLTRHPGHMSWLMQEIRAAGGLFFVDSYTTAESIALGIARESGVPAVRRDVFLDPDPAVATVKREFARLKRLARERGMAVGIGHPYPATLALLERELPKLADAGFRLVSISDYVAEARAAAAGPSRPAGANRAAVAAAK